MGLSQPHTAVDKQRIVCLARLLPHRHAGSVGEAIAGTGHKLLEGVIGVQRQRSITFIEHTAARQVLTMETDGNQPPGYRLGGGSERLLALTLAEIQLRRCANRHLNDAVGQLPRRHLIEPEPVQCGMIARTA